jgi:hypothetical protein
LLCNNPKWIYLGKDLAKREVLGQLLGEKSLLPLGDRLHTIAERLRQPFLDFIAELGKIQKDQLGWWSSACSWKDSTASDLFLLVCYEHLVDHLVQEREGVESPLFIVVEDPWLFRQLQDCHAQTPGVQFQGTCALWLLCVKAAARGFAARGIWTWRLLRNYLKQRWYWAWRTNQEIAESDIALYSHPRRHSISNLDCGWNDPYFGDLDLLLNDAGYSVCRFSHPEVGGFERALARRSSYFRPLILYATPSCFLRALAASWRFLRPVAPVICGRPIQWLVLREWWQGSSTASPLSCRFFFECMVRLLETCRLKLVIYFYENQPWEKMLVLAARAHGVATLGYQHGGGLSRFMLSFFPGRGEAEWAPVPDLLMTSGPYSHELLASGGIPRERLVMGGSLRYRHWGNDGNSVPLPPPASRVRVLVALPIEPVLAQHLVLALKRAFPDGGQSEGLAFVIQPHPMRRPDVLELFGWRATILSGTFEEAISSCSIVIYSGTSVGLEALMMGRRVIRYRSELLPNIDRTDFLTEEMVDGGDYDLRERLLSMLHEGATSQACQAPDVLLKHVFPPPDNNVWIQTVRRLCLGGKRK